MSRNDSTGDRLYRDRELAQVYDLDNQWGSDLDYGLQLANGARSVLDLGCGTGQLAAKLADRRTVIGVNPAVAMLENARRPGGRRVTWVRSDARSIRLGRHFELVALAGHAFQVFLTHKD
jgi:ubiquinone/menaquinone biosynthesis C-methylase UbiE